MTEEILKDCMTTTEAAEYLGYHSDSVCNLCIKGKLLGAFKFGKSWAIPKQSVYDYKRGPQGFAAVKAQKAKAKASWLEMINSAIREGIAKKMTADFALA